MKQQAKDTVANPMGKVTPPVKSEADTAKSKDSKAGKFIKKPRKNEAKPADVGKTSGDKKETKETNAAKSIEI